MLAKEIIDEILKISREKKLSQIAKVSLEIGQIALAHDGHSEHIEDISIENLQFGLKTITKGTLLEKTKFDIIKITGENWRLTGIKGK